VKRLLPLAIVAVLAVAVPGLARAAGPCGLPSAKPLWIDHGVPDLAPVMARPGTILAVSSGNFPAQVREKGGKTIYWDMYLNRRIGSPQAPADPATIVERANRLFDFAATQSGCATPRIVLNEMFGANLETPWSPTTAQYRANLLTFVRTIAERGGRSLLLVPSRPYTQSDEAAAWWRETAGFADIVHEVYPPATRIHKLGPIGGNRLLRTAMRRAIGYYTAIGIPTSKLGVILGFQARPGGRSGLQPAQAWFRVVKWQALAARQVAAETGVASILSWGWAAYRPESVDADKPAAACVYLWARDARLCDGPRAAGSGFLASRTEGQLRVPAGRACTVGTRAISVSQLAALTRVTGDRTVAFTMLLARVAESAHATVTTAQVRDAERAVVRLQFAGNGTAYRAALARVNATRAIARAALADELRRARIESTLHGRRPSPREIQTFYFSYPELLVRRVRARPGPAWLGGRTTGLALRSVAPERVFTMATGRPLGVFGPDRIYTVTALAEARALGSVPLAQARPAIGAALAAFARRSSFETWTLSRQRAQLDRALCRRDDMPEVGTVRLSAYLPFLSLTG